MLFMDKVWAYCSFSDDKECNSSLSMLYKLQEVIKDSSFTLQVILLVAKRCDYEIPLLQLQCLNVSKILCITNSIFEDKNNYPAFVESMQILINKYNPQYLMFGGSRHSRIIAAQLATSLESGLTAECSRYYVNAEKEIVQMRPTFEGNTYAHIISKSVVKMSTALPSPYQRISLSDKAVKFPEIETIELSIKIPKHYNYINNCYVLNIPETKKLDKFDVVFAAGMGLGSEENVNKLKEYAERNNGGFGVSRPVVEMGWAEQSDLIGMSGTVVSPNLYVAFGISGSLQHMEGMRNAAKVISINTDINAPLHQLCNSVILADAAVMLDYLMNE